MLTTAITAAIVGALSLFGVTATPWLIGAIWIGVKILVVGGIFGLVAKFMAKRKEAANDAVGGSVGPG